MKITDELIEQKQKDIKRSSFSPRPHAIPSYSSSTFEEIKQTRPK
jgi:hypothetical protein